MRARHRLAVTVAAGLLLGACTGSSKTIGPPVTTSTSAASSTTLGASATCPSSAGLSGNVADHGLAPAAGATATLSAGDFFFAPTCVTKVPAGTVSVTVSSIGQALHNFSVPDQGIDTDVEAGKTITVQVKVAAGPVTFFCKYHRTSGMVGALIPSGS
jgi:plastocyanin